MQGKHCIGCGVVFLILGVAILLLGILLVPYELPKQKNDYLIVDSKHSSQYKDWAGGYDHKNQYQMSFTFFNLTNPEQVRKTAAKPIYQQVGPYIYRRYRQAQDVEFLENGNKVQFLDFRDYWYDQEASGNRSNQDIITNMNPVYFSALAQAGSEQNMLVAAAGGLYQNFTDYLTGPFISVYTSFVMPQYLPPAINDKVIAIGASVPDPMDVFLDVWCNSTRDYQLGGSWKGLLLSSHFNKSTEISKDSAQALLNPNISLSLLNDDPLSAWTWDRALNSTYYRGILTSAFNLTDDQVYAIWYWRLEDFGPALVYDTVIQKYSLDNITDLGWVQWTFGEDILGGTSDNPTSVTIFPVEEIGYYGPIEIWGGGTPSFPDWRFSKKIMDPVTGLENITISQSLILAINNGVTDTSPWGLTYDQAQNIFGYSFSIAYSTLPQVLKNVFGPTGGLILTQNIDDWSFNCNPYLINLLLPDAPPCSLLNNHSVFANVTIFTGKSNISQINEYIAWQGSTNVSGIWAGDMPVQGCTELGQFAPNQNKSTVLHTFNDEFVRTTTLNFYNTSSVRNIATQQFKLNYTELFAPDPFFFQNMSGLTNMTNVKQAPIFYSLWDMYYVDEIYKNTSIVLDADPNITEENCTTIIDVEPISGNTLRSAKRLQANVFSPGYCPWCNFKGFPASPFGNGEIASNTFFPYVKAGEFIEVSEDLAKSIRLRLEVVKNGNKIGLIVGVVAGAVLMIGGVALITVGRSRQKHDYISIGG